MRQLAWYHAERKAPPKRKTEDPRLGSRLADLRAAGEKLRLPPCTLSYIIELLMEIGPAEHGDMGMKPLSHLEIMAWQFNTGRRLQPDEVLAVRQLSSIWVSETNRASDPAAFSPWEGAAETGLIASLEAMRRSAVGAST